MFYLAETCEPLSPAMATNGHAVNGEAHVMQQVAQQPAPPGPLAPQGIGRQNEIVIGGRDRRCEIYKFTSDQQLYASAWSNKNDIKFRLAVGTVSDVSVNPCAANKVSF